MFETVKIQLLMQLIIYNVYDVLCVKKKKRKPLPSPLPSLVMERLAYISITIFVITCKPPKLNLHTHAGFKWPSLERTLEEVVCKHICNTTLNLAMLTTINDATLSFHNLDIFLSNQLYIFYKNLFSYGKTAVTGLF